MVDKVDKSEWLFLAYWAGLALFVVATVAHSVIEKGVFDQAFSITWLMCVVVCHTWFAIEILIITPIRKENRDRERKLRDKIWEQAERIFEFENGSG